MLIRKGQKDEPTRNRSFSPYVQNSGATKEFGNGRLITPLLDSKGADIWRVQTHSWGGQKFVPLCGPDYEFQTDIVED